MGKRNGAALLGALVFFSGCAHERAFSPRQAVESIEALSGRIKTVSGKAWVSAKTAEGKAGFPARVWIDRSDPEQAQMRLEAVDLAGSTHAMMMVASSGAGQKFIWINFDKQVYYEIHDRWHGLPIRELPHLLLGLARLPKDGRAGSAGENAFRVASLVVKMEWVDPGPRLMPKEILSDAGYRVAYSHHLDAQDFYLPAKVRLEGDGGAGNRIELQMDWRSRDWNEAIDAKLFSTAELEEKVLKKFQRIQD